MPNRLTDSHVSDGCIISVAAPYAREPGQGMLVGAAFGIATKTAALNEVIPMALEGEYRIAKKTADSFTVGLLCYWDDTAKEVTITATGNRRIGWATEAIGAVAGTVTVRLSAVPAPTGA